MLTASNPTVAENRDESLYGWDWSATTHRPGNGSDDTIQTLAHQLLDALGGVLVLPGKGGFQGWQNSLESFDGEGFKVGTVYFGGREDVHVQTTGSEADVSRWAVVGIGGAKTARVDTRVDTTVSWRKLEGLVEEASLSYGSRIYEVSSRERGQSLGRTLYLGAPSSRVRVRVYEKWLEAPGEFPDGTNRVEVQLRPHTKAKERVSSWAPSETFCASRTTRELAQLLGDKCAPERTIRTAKPTPDLERTLEAMGEQYGGAVARWLEHSGGDVDTVLEYLTSKAARG